MAKKVAKKVTKKRVRKNVERGQAHIQSSFNNTRGANSAGILFTTVFTADVTGISYCQRQLSCTFGTANQLCMRDSSFFYLGYEPLFCFLLSYYIFK